MTVLSALTAALERCWSAIRVTCPETRPAAIVVYLHPRGDRRGHYSPETWTTRSNGSMDEVHVSSHILKQGPESVFRTLLHEAVHSIAHARKVQDCSRQGRYHNGGFASIAGEVGLILSKDPRIGWTTPSLAGRAKAQYRNTILDLAQTLDLWQDLNLTLPTPKGKTNGSSRKLVCPQCKRILRASRKTVELGAIVCAPCQVEFLVDRPNAHDGQPSLWSTDDAIGLSNTA